MNEIAQERYHQYTHSSNSNSSDAYEYDYNPTNDTSQSSSSLSSLVYKNKNDVLTNVSVHTPTSTNDLLSVISNLEEEIIVTNNTSLEEQQQQQQTQEGTTATTTSMDYPVKLIILDSIAAPARRDFGSEDATSRVTAIFQIAQILKRIADQMNVAIVVINQIDKIENHSNKSNQTMMMPSVKAALGTSWHHCVSTRILLEHDSNDPSFDDVYDDGTPCIRKVTIVKSNLVGRSSVKFEITKMGVSQI